MKKIHNLGPIAVLISVAIAVVFTAGCSGSAGEERPAKSEQEREAKLRIVTLGGGATEVVYALGHGDTIVATDASSTYPEQAASRASLGYYRRVQAEGIIAQAPNLVIASDGSGPPAALAQLGEVGIRVVELPEVENLAQAKARITILAELLREEERGRALIAGIDEQLVKVERALSGRPRPRVLFIYARGGGTMLVAGQGTAAEALIGLAGGALAAPEHQGFRPLTAEAVIGARPDVILLTSGGLESMGGVEGVLGAPGVAATPAGAQRRIIAMDDLLLLSFGPRLAEAVTSLAKSLHPEVVS